MKNVLKILCHIGRTDNTKKPVCFGVNVCVQTHAFDFKFHSIHFSVCDKSLYAENCNEKKITVFLIESNLKCFEAVTQFIQSNKFSTRMTVSTNLFI